MKKTIYLLTCTATAVNMLVACSTGKQAQKTVTATPAPCMLTPDSANRVQMDLLFRVPRRAFSKRSRLIITPQLMVNDSLYDEYLPLVMDAPIYEKKKHRLVELEGYADPYAGQVVQKEAVSGVYELPYHEQVQLPEGGNSGRIVGVVTTDGCGECTGIDTLDLASISNPATLVDVKKSLNLVWIEPEFVIRPKELEGRGVAHLQFVINKHDIRPDMGNNRAELKQMIETLQPILQDSLATLTKLAIFGMASADGSLAFNTPLAENRAQAAKRWLIQELQLHPEVQRLIRVGSRPEGWQPVLDAMTADGNRDSVRVKEILQRYADANDDVQERYIRRLSIWPVIRENYLQKDRKVEYEYSYKIKSFTTDDELLRMYDKRPDAFNEDELLRVASLATTHERKKEVYQTLMKYFPQSKVAANNLAVLYLREGNEAEARRVLDSLEEHSVETLNTLAASYVYAGDYERAIELLQTVDLPQARYNLGLLKAKQCKLDEAYALLAPYADLNAAICALSVNKNAEAQNILAKVTDSSAVAAYVRALLAARMQEEALLFGELPKACSDEKLRLRARTEPDFDAYREDKRFLQAVEK